MPFGMFKLRPILNTKTTSLVQYPGCIYLCMVEIRDADIESKEGSLEGVHRWLIVDASLVQQASLDNSMLE